MLAIRYAIALPRDYDMSVIRERVATKGHALDDYAGLLFKAYCLSEVGINGATQNLYAPFYVWSNTSRMGQFLWGGDGFQGIERDFGRPAIDSWAVTSVHLTEGKLREARYATFATSIAAPATTLDEVAGQHKASASLAMARKDTAATVRGIDMGTGATMAFTVLSKLPRNSDVPVFEVAHVSVPGGHVATRI